MGQAGSIVGVADGSFVEDHEIMGFAWKIMADPEGNHFCIAATP